MEDFSETEIEESETDEEQFRVTELENNSLKRKEGSAGEESGASTSATSPNPAKKLRDDSASTITLATWNPPLIQSLSMGNGNAYSSSQGDQPAFMGNGNNSQVFGLGAFSRNGNTSYPHFSASLNQQIPAGYPYANSMDSMSRPTGVLPTQPVMYPHSESLDLSSPRKWVQF